MKKKPLILLISAAAILASCSQGGQTASSSESSSESSSQTSSTQESASSEESSSEQSSSEPLHVAEEMIGRWYITSSSFGVLPLNGIFDIAEDDTLAIGQVVLSLKGNYAGYEDTYFFTYGTISFTVSYDADKKGLDWGYQNASEYDIGFASSEPINNGYAYEGSEYPMDKINSYIGTSGNVPAYASSTYKLKLFTSYYNSKPCGGLEIPSTSLDAFKAYIETLLNSGYTFPAYTGEVSRDKFYVGYDEDKVYTLRMIYFSDDKEADVFYHAYDESLLPKGSSSNE